MSNRPISRLIPPISLFPLFGLASCDLDSTAPHHDSPGPAGSSRVAGVVEVRFEGIGSPDMTTSALVGGSMAELEALRAERARTEARGETFTPGTIVAPDLEVPTNTDGSGDATIHLEPVAAGAFTTFEGEGFRYFQATYSARNAQLSDQAAFDTPREDLTFLPVNTARTIELTPVLVFETADGSAADPALALELLPTGAADLDDASGAVVSAFPDVLQVFEEAEVAGLDLPEAVADIYPYGFMVRRAGDETTRMLDPAPEDDQFDGIINFAFRIPLQANRDDDPSTISLMFLALDDSETRVTQSLEEQNPDGLAAFRDRADNLENVAAVNLLPGGTPPGLAGIATRFICSVRTAGPAGAPAAHLVDAGGMFQSFSPDPYAAEGSFVPTNTTIAATFNEPVEGAGPETFTVRGLQSGPAFLGQAYTGNGMPNVTTPAGDFFPGEEIEIVLTSVLSCPPWVARLRVAAASGSGDFGTQTTFDAGSSPASVAIGDLNVDGNLDVVTANTGSDDVSVLPGNGDGTLQAQQTFPVDNGVVALAIGDLDGDGVPDLVTASRLSDDVSALLGNGDGTFQAQQIFGVGGQPSSVAIADLNADGILDLAVANRTSGDFSVLIGNGDGTFQPQQTFDAGNELRSVAIGDLDGDGSLDLATADRTSGGVSVLIGNGDGTYQPQQTFDGGNQPDFVVTGDLNGDGNPDIAIANRISNDVSVLLGNGDGTYQPQQTFDVGGEPRSVVIGDVNGDGSLDLSTANFSSDDVSILLGNGDGTFQPHQLFTAGAAPESVAIGDMNGDGILDLATANASSNNVSVLLGEVP